MNVGVLFLFEVGNVDVDKKGKGRELMGGVSGK